MGRSVANRLARDDGYYAMSHEEIAQVLGLTRQRVAQIERVALCKLRRNPILRELW